MNTRAYELREGIDPELFGGSITRPDGTSFDVRAALDEGNGVIVTNDEHVATALDRYEPLKRAAVPEGVDVSEEGVEFVEPPVDADTFDEAAARASYNAQTKDDLIRNANDRDPALVIPAGTSKAEVVDALVNADKEGAR